MRAAALIAALACATAAHADSARESRYGPAPDRPPAPMNGQGPGFTGAGYGGQMLGWTGKREVVAPQVQEQAVQQPWWAQQQQVAPQPQVQAAPAWRPQPQQPPQAYAQPARAVPQAIYANPPAPAAAPVQTAYAQPPQGAPQPRALQPGQIGVRTYSVGRQFGMAPDPIPDAGPSRMVLIAPPASAPEDDDQPRQEDDRDWSAQSGKTKKDSDQ